MIGTPTNTPMDPAALQAYLQQLLQQQSGLKSMPSGNGSLAAQAAPTSAPVNVPSFTSTLGNGQTFNPTNSLQSGINAAYNQNSANGIAVNPANFARWQNYPASPAINKTYPGLGGAVGGAGSGGVVGGGVGTPGGGTGGSGIGSNPSVFTPGMGPSAPGGTPSTTAPGTPGSTTFGNYTSALPKGPATPGMGQQSYQNYFTTPGNVAGNGQNSITGFRFVNPSDPMTQEFNALMQQGNPSAAYSMLLAQPGNVGKYALQNAWDPNNTQLFNNIVNTFGQGHQTSTIQGMSPILNAGQLYGYFGANGQWVPGNPNAPTTRGNFKGGGKSG